MRKNKWIIALLVFSLCLSVFAGCKESGQSEDTAAPTTQAPTTEPTTQPTTEPTTVPTEPPMDAATLLDAIGREDQPMFTSADFLVELVMALESGDYGMTLDVAAYIDGSIAYSPETAQLYGGCELGMHMLGMQERLDFVLYGMDEGEGMVFYLGIPDMESWLKFSKEDLFKNLDEDISQTPETEFPLTEMVLQEEPVEYNGMECYALTLHPDMQKAMQDAMDALAQEDGTAQLPAVGDTPVDVDAMELDFSVIHMPITFYVEESTLLVRGVTVEFQGLDTFLNTVLESAEEEMTDSMGMDISSLRFEINNICYEPVEVPQISQEDREIADEQNYDPEQEDGSYLFKGAASKYRVVFPEAWELLDAEAGYFAATYHESDVGEEMAYIIVEGRVEAFDMSMKDYVAAVANSYAQILGVEVPTGTCESMEGFEIMWYCLEDTYHYVMRIPGGEESLLIEISCYDVADPYVYLRQMAEGITVVE